MAYDQSIFNINPYYDDYDSQKGFLRVLFKPGYSIQARELTTVQSILQDQVSKIGDHLFKDGSRIVGGAITVRNAYFIMLKVGEGTAFQGITDYSFVLGATLKNSDGSIRAVVSHYLKPDSTDGNLVLVVDFISGSSFELNTNYTLELSDQTSTTYTVKTEIDSRGRGSCKLISITDGIFYINGFFIRNFAEVFSPYRIDNGFRDFSFTQTYKFDLLSRKIGFSVLRDIVTEDEDGSLRDPSIGTYNYNAPGADRFKIQVSLSQTDTIQQNPDDFIELLRFEEGKITKKSERVTYGEIERTLARRTYDESGSYIVKPFDVDVNFVNNDPVEPNLEVNLSSGKAYVFGHEVETNYPRSIEIAKARTTESANNISFSQTVGNYVTVKFDPAWGISIGTYLPLFANGTAKVYFRDSTGNAIAEANVHGLLPVSSAFTQGSVGGFTGTRYNMYLYGVSGYGNKTIAGASTAVLTPHVSTPTSVIPKGTWGQAYPSVGTTFSDVQRTVDQSLVYEIKPGYAIERFTNLSFYGRVISDILPADAVNYNAATKETTYKVNLSSFAGTIPSTPASGEFRFKNYGTNSTSFADVQQIQIIKNDGQVFSPAFKTNSYSITSNSTSEFIVRSNDPPAGFTGGSLRVACPYQYFVTNFDDTTIRRKVSNTASKTFTLSSELKTDPDGRKYVQFPYWDVYSVTSVLRSDGVDITADMELDDGQRETHYDYSRLYIKPSKAPNYGSSVSFTVNYKYFSHVGYAFAPFVGSHSYPTYSEIPLYTNRRTGKTVSLANCIDFRHSGSENHVSTAKPYGSSEGFGSAEFTVASYTHYLPRIDKVKLSLDPIDNSAKFEIESGEPDLAPIAPPDSDEKITLATLTIPSYTHNPKDVTVTPFENKRFTMADIGKIEKRIDDVETFAKLSLNEIDVEAKPLAAILGVSTEPLKTSIFTDDFFGHGGSDVVSAEHICSVDYENGDLRPFFTHLPVTISTLASPTISGLTVSSQNIWTLDYSTSNYINNQSYTKTVKPNSSNTINWLGFIELGTPIVSDFDRGYRPFVRTNSVFENDNWIASGAGAQEGFGTQWNDWESIWTGIQDKEEEIDFIQNQMLALPRTFSSSNVPGVNNGNNRVGVDRSQPSDDQRLKSYLRSKQLRNHTKVRVDSRVVDRTVVPYIPPTSIPFTAYGLKPNSTGINVYFDGEQVLTGLSTNSNGTCSGVIGIQGGKFLAGEKTIRVSDAESAQNSNQGADAIFYCGSLFAQRDSGSYSTRPPILRRQVVTSEGIIKDPFNRDVSYDSVEDTVENNQWTDPLSQTFFVDKKTTPEGIFLKNITLYFSSKDTSLPVTVQLRPTINGYPSPSVSIPFSTVTKLPSSVVVSKTNGIPNGTVFTFSSPIYLEPGEYAIVVMTNSSKYELYSADTGLLNSSGGVSGTSSLVGTLFYPQNVGQAVPNNISDIAFTIDRCLFTTTSGILTYAIPAWSGAQVAKIYNPEIIPNQCSINRTLDGKVMYNNQNMWPTSVFSNSTSVQYRFARGINNAVSPVLDMGAIFGLAAKMTITDTPTVNSPTSSYVSKAVVLPEENVSNGVVVLADSCIPIGSSIQVYFRYSSSGESDLFDRPWTPMVMKNAFNSVSDIDFREGRWVYTSSNISIRAYQIKIVMLAPSSSPYNKTPAVKNLRAVTIR